MQHVKYHDTESALAIAFMIAFLIVACTLVLFFASRQSASQDIHLVPRTGIEDLSTRIPNDK